MNYEMQEKDHICKSYNIESIAMESLKIKIKIRTAHGETHIFKEAGGNICKRLVHVKISFKNLGFMDTRQHVFITCVYTNRQLCTRYGWFKTTT